MDAMSIYDRYFQNSPLKNQQTDDIRPWHIVCGFGVYHVSTNNESKLTLTYLTSRLNLIPNAFKWETS